MELNENSLVVDIKGQGLPIHGHYRRSPEQQSFCLCHPDKIEYLEEFEHFLKKSTTVTDFDKATSLLSKVFLVTLDKSNWAKKINNSIEKNSRKARTRSKEASWPGFVERISFHFVFLFVKKTS